MPKAKIIDRLEYTKSRRISFVEVEKSSAAPPELETHGDVCPMCGKNTLTHISGCVSCTNPECLWSKCG